MDGSPGGKPLGDLFGDQQLQPLINAVNQKHIRNRWP